MRIRSLLLAIPFALGLAACSATTPEQAGGSGMGLDYTPIGFGKNWHGCWPDDINCNAIYDYPGGG